MNKIQDRNWWANFFVGALSVMCFSERRLTVRQERAMAAGGYLQVWLGGPDEADLPVTIGALSISEFNHMRLQVLKSAGGWVAIFVKPIELIADSIAAALKIAPTVWVWAGVLLGVFLLIDHELLTKVIHGLRFMPSDELAKNVSAIFRLWSTVFFIFLVLSAGVITMWKRSNSGFKNNFDEELEQIILRHFAESYGGDMSVRVIDSNLTAEVI
jgi:hypothetical protein